jgi:hypothetical protein
MSNQPGEHIDIVNKLNLTKPNAPAPAIRSRQIAYYTPRAVLRLFAPPARVQLSDDRDVVAALGYVHWLKGDTAKAEAAFAELKEREKAGFVSAYDKTLINLGLGDREQATDWLDEAYKERSYWLIYMQVDPAIDPLRTSSRFAELLKKVVGSEAIASGFVETPTSQSVTSDTVSPPHLWSRVFLILLALLLLVIVALAIVRYF